MKSKTIVYIDGLNFYHAIRDLNLPHLKWVDLLSLSKSILRKHEALTDVRYYTAHSTWLPDSYYRHRQYTAALEHLGATIIYGQFKKKYLKCMKCGRKYTTREEKETDVNIAIDLVSDAFLDKYDRAILVTADTDLAPPVNKVRAQFPKKEILVVAPPGRMNRARELKHRYMFTAERLEENLLPDKIVDADGNEISTRPPEYDPPE